MSQGDEQYLCVFLSLPLHCFSTGANNINGFHLCHLDMLPMGSFCCQAGQSDVNQTSGWPIMLLDAHQKESTSGAQSLFFSLLLVCLSSYCFFPNIINNSVVDLYASHT